MWYELDSEPGMKFANVGEARRYAVKSFAKWERMGIGNPYIRVLFCNYAGKSEIGVVKKGPGYPVYKTDKGTVRLTASGNLAKKKKKNEYGVPDNWHPFGL